MSPSSFCLIKDRARLALLTTLMLASAARAQSQSQPLVLTAYINSAGGANLTLGKYADALAQIKPGGLAYAYRSAATNTNLCVAYIGLRQLPDAQAACDAAVANEESERVSVPVWISNGHGSSNPQLALAYSNRAVLNEVRLDRLSAQRDLAKAATAAPDAIFVQRNQRALAARQAPVREASLLN
jgi:hypothetical protein